MSDKALVSRETGRITEADSLRRHRIAAARRRAARQPAGLDPFDPFDDEALAAALDWMADGIDAGRDPIDLRAEIATRLWPWVSRVCDRALRRLPRHADGAEVRGRVATVLWQCCARLDPEQPPGWAAWLHVRIRGAVADAARAADPLSRRDRAAVADAGPDGALGRGVHTVPLDDAGPLSVAGPDPCQVLVDGTIRDALQRWIADDLPADVADRLQRWWHTTGATTSLPAGLAEELRPYLFRLVPAASLLD